MILRCKADANSMQIRCKFDGNSIRERRKSLGDGKPVALLPNPVESIPAVD